MILVANNEGWPGVAETAARLTSGARALDAIEAGIRLVEADERVRSVGRGGWANLVGRVQLDAAVMDGDTLRSGAVGAIEGFAHPVSIARAVLERLPHELLVGPGAERFAREIGAEAGDNLTPESAAEWRAWFLSTVDEAARADFEKAPLAELCQRTIDPERGRDTTVFLAIDGLGSLASGVSTSGWAWKYPGRLGDSPIIGAGSYADSRHGAAACTGTGEMAIRCSTARSIVLYMKTGMGVEEAVHAAADDLRGLKGGLVQRITLHAIDAGGGHHCLAVNAGEPRHYWLWEAGDAAPRSTWASSLHL